MTHPAVTAHLLACDEVGRWLLLRNARDHTRWQLPGGRAEPGESPAEAAARETREETGLALPVQRLITVAWVPPKRPGRRARLAFIFATRVLAAEDLTSITVQAAEVDAWRLSPPETAVFLLHPLVAERLAQAHLHGPGLYLDQIPLPGRTVV